MSTMLHLPGYDLDLPADPGTFDRFRQWTLSDSFPEKGRIDYLAGRLEVDMSPESLYTHGNVKTKIVARLVGRAEVDDIGDVFSDQTRIVSERIGLSTEPDVILLTHEALDSGRVRLTPKSNRSKDAVEIVGAPDLVVEVVSDSSVAKDTRELFALYFEAGVREYWLVDARGDELVFRLLIRGEDGWIDTDRDHDGFLVSTVLGRRYRLDRSEGRRGEWRYDLIERELV